MHRLLPRDRARELRPSKAELAGIAQKKLHLEGRLNVTDTARFLMTTPLTIKAHMANGNIETTIIGRTHYIEGELVQTLKKYLDTYGSLAMAFKAEAIRERHRVIEGSEDHGTA